MTDRDDNKSGNGMPTNLLIGGSYAVGIGSFAYSYYQILTIKEEINAIKISLTQLAELVKTNLGPVKQIPEFNEKFDNKFKKVEKDLKLTVGKVNNLANDIVDLSEDTNMIADAISKKDGVTLKLSSSGKKSRSGSSRSSKRSSRVEEIDEDEFDEETDVDKIIDENNRRKK